MEERTATNDPVGLPVGSETDPSAGAIRPAAVLQQLERILAGPHFRHSRRYPAFLRYVVERTLDGAAGELKERNIAVDVFARAPSYDPSIDPIVRITAGEVRKRLAQYYQHPGRESEIRIDLPLGSYLPEFSFPVVSAALPPLTAPVQITPRSWGSSRWLAVCLAIGLLALSATVLSARGAGRARWSSSGIRSFRPAGMSSWFVSAVQGCARSRMPRGEPEGDCSSPGGMP